MAQILIHAIFWISLALLLFTYAGYPALLTLLVRIRRIPPAPSGESFLPFISLVIPAHNEAVRIEAKLRNSLEQDYPADRLEIIVVNDGSTDDTLALLLKYALHADTATRSRLRIESFERSRGKTAAVNRGVEMARGEVLVFSDADSLIQPGSLRFLATHFADPRTGCAAGRYAAGGLRGPNAVGAGLYWRYEDYLRRQESGFGGILGASGSLYAVRRALYVPLRPGLINDDFIIPMLVSLQGRRSIYEPQAVAVEDDSRNAQVEFGRRVRIMAGNCQHLWLFRRLFFTLPHWRLVFQMACHKMLRVLSPIFLLILFTSSILLLPHPFFIGMAATQIAFYALALAGRMVLIRTGKMAAIFSLPYYFTLLNLAAVVGIYRFMTRPGNIAWHTEHEPARATGAMTMEPVMGAQQVQFRQ